MNNDALPLPPSPRLRGTSRCVSAVTLTGWGQPHDALADIAPGARHVDYAAQDTVEGVFSLLAREIEEAELLIGWSMGGQMAVRAIVEGVIAPKKLVLIATPYRFIRGENGIGMDPLIYAQFLDNYRGSPARTLHKSYALIAHHDRNGEVVREKLQRAHARQPQHDWLPWLERLGAYDCDALDFSRLPPTLLLHGKNDAVVGYEQSERFAAELPDARLELWEGCGHAPHWHDKDKAMKIIQEFAA